MYRPRPSYSASYPQVLTFQVDYAPGTFYRTRQPTETYTVEIIGYPHVDGRSIPRWQADGVTCDPPLPRFNHSRSHRERLRFIYGATKRVIVARTGLPVQGLQLNIIA